MAGKRMIMTTSPAPRPAAYLPRLSPARLEEYAVALEDYIETVRKYGERMAGGEGVMAWCVEAAKMYREHAEEGERR